MAGEHSEDGRIPLDAVALLRAQPDEVHRRLETPFTEWLRELLPSAPPPRSQPVGVFIHAATVEDIAVHTLLLGAAPLFATVWAGRGPSQYSTLNLAPILSYAHDVFAVTDAYLAGLSVSAISDRVDLSRLNLGYPTVGWVVSQFVILELAQMSGELVSAVQAARTAG
jgi:hypothetical protein